MQKTSEYLTIGRYSPHTVRNYLSELRYFFMYYADVLPLACTEDMVIQYLLYLNKTLKCSRDKCRLAAQSIAFFFRHVVRKPFVVPTLIFPRKSKKLPPVMSQEEVKALIDTIENLKHRTVVMLLYSTGMRLSEVANLKIADIDSTQMRIKVVQGKGAKDRYTILSEQVLRELRAYYLIYRPKEYLFNGMKEGHPLSTRSIEKLVQMALVRLGLQNKYYSVHTLRHSSRTHLVDLGADLHTVKELLGHANLQTTVRYLHLSTERTRRLTNPYDALPEVEATAGRRKKKG
jgi:site-specific recombinase XerD